MKSFNAALLKTGESVLNDWAMMFVESCEKSDEIFPVDSDLYAARATYSGVFDGTLTVFCQKDFLEVLCRNVLGMEADEVVGEQERLDSLRELANVVSGNFLVNAFGDETVFDLPHFEVFHGAAKTFSKPPSEFCVLCKGDGSPVGFSFEIRGS